MWRGTSKVVSQVGLPVRQRQRARSIVSARGRAYVSFGSSKSIDPARRTDPIPIVMVILKKKRIKINQKVSGIRKRSACLTVYSYMRLNIRKTIEPMHFLSVEDVGIPRRVWRLD